MSADEESTAQPVPASPSCACDTHGNTKGTKTSCFFLHCSKAAVLNRGILGLCRVSLSFGSSFSVIRSWFLQFSHVLYIQPVLCKFSVRTKCRMIGSSQFSFWPGTLQKATFWLPWLSPFLGNDHTSLGLLVCSYLPHPAALGVPAARIWLGQLLAKLSLVHLITGRVCMGWDYAFSCHKRAFCLKRLRAWSIKTFLNPAISCTMLSCVGLYQLQCHQRSLTDTVQNQHLTELQVTLFSQLMVSPFLTCTCAKSHWAVLDTMFLLTVGPGLSLSYGMISSDSFSFPCWVQMLHRNLIYTKSTLECTY